MVIIKGGDTINKVTKNAFWIIGCKIIKAFLTFVVTMFISRYLGPSNYGLINYAASLVTFVTPLMKLGLDATLVYELINNKNDEGGVLGSSIFMCLCSSILCLIGIISFVFFVNSGEMDTLIVTALYGLLLIFQALEMIQYWYQANLLSKYSSIAMLISYIIISIIQIILLFLDQNVYWFAASYSIDFLIISVILLLIYFRKSKSKLYVSKKICKRLINRSKYYIISSMMITIFAQTDKIMIKLLMNNEFVGYYSAAITCANMFSFIFAAIIDSLRPVAFETKTKSKEEFDKKMIQMYSIIIYFSLFVSLMLSIFSPLIINIMYGSQYEPSILALRIVVWYTTFSYMGTIRNVWIMAEKKQKYLLLINLSGAIFNIIFNFILIPNFGIYGAAFASLITQIFTNIIIGFMLKQIRENNVLMIKGLNFKNIILILKNINKKERI